MGTDRRFDFLQEKTELTNLRGEDGRVLMRYLGKLIPYPPTPEETAAVIRERESDPRMEQARRQTKEAQDFHDQKMRSAAERERTQRGEFDTRRPDRDLDIDSLDGEEFEQYLIDLFGRMGYFATLVSPTSHPDFGVDILLLDDPQHPKLKIAVQAKCYTGAVGIQAVQEVFAGKRHHGCKKALVVTNSTFTQAAIELARSTGVVLIDRTKLLEIISNPSPYQFG